MLEIDGSQRSGSGTILRLSIAFAAILNQSLHIYNIRENRPQPGLKPQHLTAVLTSAKLCEGRVTGAKLGSRELWFHPKHIVGGTLKVEIGTAGSIPMILITTLPICAFAKSPVHIHIAKGGTDVFHSPTINYLSHILFPALNEMGLRASLKIHKYGYYPKGMGEVSVDIQPNPILIPLNLDKFEEPTSLKGISVCTFLKNQKVAERQAKAAIQFLNSHGYEPDIQVINDSSNPLQKGSSITLWAQSNENLFLGGDAIGELGKPSEAVGKEAAKNLLVDLQAKATVDVHLADLLVPYIALAKEKSAFLVRSITEHAETNMWLAQRMLDVKFKTSKIKGLYLVEKRAQ